MGEHSLTARRLGLLRTKDFHNKLKTLLQLILNSTWPHVITYTKRISSHEHAIFYKYSY